MARHEFRLLDAEGEVSATKHYQRSSDEAAIQGGLTLISGCR